MIQRSAMVCRRVLSTAARQNIGAIPVSDDFADEAGYTRLAQTLHRKQHKQWTKGQFTVFYDGSCPLCSREIAHYQGLESDVLFLNLFDYTQLTTVGSLLAEHNIKLEDAKRRMHILTEEQKVVRNAEAFVEIWRRMPYWRVIVPFLDNKLSMTLANSAYDMWAERRYRNRQEMDDSAKCSLAKKEKE
jgi:predicted DCC family thiol-disulfide oxidoreductase YuxK